MSCDDAQLNWCMDLNEFARAVRKRAGSDLYPTPRAPAPPKTPKAPAPEPEASIRIGNYEITFPRSSSDSAKPTKPAQAAQPKDELIDLFTEREARLKGEVSEREIEEAKPEAPYEPLHDYRFWEEVNRRHEAELKGEKPVQWCSNRRFAEPPDALNLYKERMQQQAAEAIGKKADEAESEARKALMDWYEKRKAQNK